MMDNSADDTSSVEIIYREVGPDLLAFFRARHGSPQTAEDLLQETFAAVMKKPERLLQADSPRAYLFGVARNLSAELYRRSRPTEVLADEPLTELEQETPDARLEMMREGIRRRLQHELSYEEMAATLNVPVGTIRSRMHHAVRQLRGHLKSRLYEK